MSTPIKIGYIDFIDEILGPSGVFIDDAEAAGIMSDIQDSGPIIKPCLEEYLYDANTPLWLSEAITKYPVNFILYDIGKEFSYFHVHVGAIGTMCDMLGMEKRDQDKYIEQAMDAASEVTSDYISLEDVTVQARHIDLIWKSFNYHDESIEPELQYILSVERKLKILMRDNIEEPWELVQNKFSLGNKAQLIGTSPL